jgi:rhamnulokinase
MKPCHFLAFDLGAESGRTMIGTLADEKLKIRELTRFPNGTTSIQGNLRWNIFSLFEEVKKGIKACAAEVTPEPRSLAVDTWGVDFGLLAGDGSILGLPFAYRDPRNIRAMEDFFKLMPREKIYELTGIQFMPFNSLFQLHALARENGALLQAATKLLFMPDLFNYLLTGEKSSEFTISTTSQLYDPRRGEWSRPLFKALGVPIAIMPELLKPATVIGPLLESVAQDAGLAEVPVVATASHDTASAIAAVPAEGRNWAYISSGTWSCMGIEITEPIVTPEAMKLNFTNEGGIAGTFRFLKNISGLWLVHQCRKKWASQRDFSYEELTALAVSSAPFRSLIDPDVPDFLSPADMPGAITQFCRRTKQKSPESPAEFMRCILESLALKCRFVLDELRKVSPLPIEKIHVFGGGSKNRPLCQFTANAAGLPVVAGPAEATTMGNIMGQALALGFISSPSDIRATIRRSAELEIFEPQAGPEWASAYERFQNLIGR